MSTYQEMEKIITERMEQAGLLIGKKIMVGKRMGMVSGYNPFFFDHEDPKVYVFFLPDGGRKSTTQMVPASKIKIIDEVTT